MLSCIHQQNQEKKMTEKIPKKTKNITISEATHTKMVNIQVKLLNINGDKPTFEKLIDDALSSYCATEGLQL
jgi:hypothetical protein